MFYLRKLCSFTVDSTFMKMFYSCCIESVITFSVVCWYGSLNVENRNRLQGIVKVCGKIAGTTLKDLNDLYKARTLKSSLWMIPAIPCRMFLSCFLLLADIIWLYVGPIDLTNILYQLPSFYVITNHLMYIINASRCFCFCVVVLVCCCKWFIAGCETNCPSGRIHLTN